MTSRRAFLGLACGALAGAARAQTQPRLDAQRRAALEQALRTVTGGAPVREGRVKLELPPLVDNGNTVPLTVTVESPMSVADHVRSIHVFTEKNPQPYVISARLGPRCGAARLETRARIADTGSVIAIAQLSDGSWWSGSMTVVVTLAACMEDGLI